jgi:rubrerythrin
MAKSKRDLGLAFASQAEEEGNTQVAKLLRASSQAMEENGGDVSLQSLAYPEALTGFEKSLDEEWPDNSEKLEDVDYYVCAVCGHTRENKPSEHCPVCTAKASAFFKVA